MKIIEEQLLLNNIKNIKAFVNANKTMPNIYENISSLENKSLQDLSLKSDILFFDEISFILSVITSIVTHPQITTKTEDIILRAELAPSLQNDAFLRVLQDDRMWKQKKLKMEPEYVYYHQSIDEIRTYENRFIVKVINIIDQELKKYNEFYISLLKSFDFQDSLSEDGEKQEKAMIKINLLLKKIKFIKNTRFYKEVSKSKEEIRYVQPTNILLKNRLYNYCFKFYRKHIAYDDKIELEQDFRVYYFTLLLNSLKKNGFKYAKSDQKKTFKFTKTKRPEFNNIKFESKLFKLVINEDINGFVITISKGRIKVNHLLMFDVDNGFNRTDLNLRKRSLKNNEFVTIESLTVWKKSFIENINEEKNTFDIKVSKDNIISEQELMDKWLESKISHSYASKELYEKYCPVCKGMDKEVDNNIYECKECNSIYTFYNEKNKDVNKQCIWFIRVRGI